MRNQLRTTGSTEAAPAQLLEEAFTKFTEASARLEERHLALQLETEELRTQLKKKDLEIQRAERLATLGEMAAAIAHEVRNPLGAIKLFLSLLADDMRDRPDSLALVKNIDHSIESLDHVVSNILQFSKGHKAQLFPLNLHAVIQEQVTQCRGSYPEVTWDVKLSGGPFVAGNEHTLRQVFHNLLLNACQAMKGKGQALVTVSANPQGTTVAISDSGPGIAAAVINRLFEPFVTTRNEGTGLGLAIVKQVLDNHGATITANNRSSGGAEFSIFFPAPQVRSGVATNTKSSQERS